MKNLLYVICALFMVSSCSSLTRSPLNEVSKDLVKDGDSQLISDPSGDQIVIEDQDDNEDVEVVVSVDCSARVAPIGEIAIDGKLDKYGKPISTVIVAEEVDSKPSIDVEACSYNCNDDEVLDCKDIACQELRERTRAVIEILNNYKISCSSLDTGREIYKELEPVMIDGNGGEAVVNRELSK